MDTSKHKLIVFVSLAMLTAGNVSAQSAPAHATTNAVTGAYVPVYPIKVSSNGRYMVDQNNVPWLLMGDAEHTLLSNLSSSDIAVYLADRAYRGFNSVELEMPCGTLRDLRCERGDV